MRLVLLLALTAVAWCEAVYVYSSFYAPLADPRVLGYRLDARFDEESGRRAREAYERRYGFRGQNLILDMGNGRGPPAVPRDTQEYGDVKFYYTRTYSGAPRTK